MIPVNVADWIVYKILGEYFKTQSDGWTAQENGYLMEERTQTTQGLKLPLVEKRDLCQMSPVR